MKMPGHIRNYLASANGWLKNRLPRRDRAPHHHPQCNSAECVGCDIDDGALQSSNEINLSEEFGIPVAPLGFAIPGGANGSFDFGGFSEPMSANNNVAAWMGVSVAVSAFVLVFGGYVVVAGMGNPAGELARAEALGPRGVVMGMAWLPGDIATFPEVPAAPAASASQPADAPTQKASIADAKKTKNPERTTAVTPVRERARSAVAATRRETTLRPGDACVDKNQRGCFRRYVAKGPSANSPGGSSADARHVLRDFEQPAQGNEPALAPPRTASFYQHH